MVLGSNKLDNHTTEAKLEWLKQEWEDTVAAYGSVQAAEDSIKKSLDAMVDPPSGMKPEHGNPDVKYIRIPDTNLSLRFWPGAASIMEYCMDFVETDTKEPLNVPDDYELWSVPDRWFEPVARRLVSLERRHGIPADKIEKGEEKLILRDGMHCDLMRDGERVMRFKVPARPRPIAAASSKLEVEYLVPQ